MSLEQHMSTESTIVADLLIKGLSPEFFMSTPFVRASCHQSIYSFSCSLLYWRLYDFNIILLSILCKNKVFNHVYYPIRDRIIDLTEVYSGPVGYWYFWITFDVISMLHSYAQFMSLINDIDIVTIDRFS